MSAIRTTITDVAELETLLSEPTPGAIAALGRLEGDLLLLGVGGKMGPTLARMARRASDAWPKELSRIRNWLKRETVDRP